MTALKAENAQLHQANSVLEQTIDTLSSQQQSLNDLANELILQAEEQPEEEQLIEDLEPPVAEEPSVEMEKAEDSAPVSADDDFAPADDVVAEVEEAAETPLEELPLADDEAPMEAETEAAPEPAESENAPAEAATSDFGEGIDDFLDDIDWLVPSPPSNKKPQPPEPEPEPVPERKKPDSRQMSLF